MKLPIQNPKTNNYQSLEDIQARKDELLDQLHTENTHFSAKWNQLFMAKEDHSKTRLSEDFLSTALPCSTLS